MQNFSEKPQNIFLTKGHAGNGPIMEKSEIVLLMPELVIGAWETESLIGNGFHPYGLGINMAIFVRESLVAHRAVALCQSCYVPYHSMENLE